MSKEKENTIGVLCTSLSWKTSGIPEETHKGMQ